MAPDHVKRWMSTHLQELGTRPLGEICLPGSHDSGMWRLGLSTSPGGTASNVLTQTLSIYDQLDLGVRWFDIRPTLTRETDTGPAIWACGHYSNVPVLGWQGGNGATIDEVVNDVNRFTNDNPELIILQISHIHHLRTKNSAELPLDAQQRLDLLTQLGRLQNVYHAADPKNAKLQDVPLNTFIGGGKASVILLFDDGFDEAQLFSRNFFAQRYNPYTVYGEWITVMQDDMDAILSTINPWQVFGPKWNVNSVLSLTELHQKEEFPFSLQWVSKQFPSLLAIDNVRNGDLLTMALAITYQRLNLHLGVQNTVIVYGGKPIVAPDVQQRMSTSVHAPGTFKVTNDNLGGDPWAGMHKSCAVYYNDGGFIKGRFGQENGSIHFEQDILSVVYGGVTLRSQDVYSRLYRMLVERDHFRVSNDSMGGDPKFGVVKTCVVRYREFAGASGDVEEKKVQEGDVLDFKTFWERMGENMANALRYQN